MRIRLTQGTIVMLARMGDEQAIAVLANADKKNRFNHNQFFFDSYYDLYHVEIDCRRNTNPGMPALNQQRLHELVDSRVETD